MSEEWKSYNENYEVSTFGNVRNKKTFRILKPWLSGSGYYKCQIGKNRLRKRVNRMVAETFLPNENNLPVCDHINHIRTDNRVENLRWVSYRDNNLNRTKK
jgi:hypothetical protein